ncbi:MAG: hypothetical protein Kow0042_22920 [Calditrichia bacterium]
MARKLIKCLIVMVGLAVLFSCAGSKKAMERPPAEEPAETMDESFDPLILNDEDIQFDTEQKTGAESPSLMETPGPETEKPLENKLVDGFRVQILSTKDLESATRAKHIAMEQFSDLNLRVYLDFGSPYYKVRVGDFKSREEAQQLRDEIRRRGYPKAWIVPSKVWSNPELFVPSDSTNSDFKLPENE